MTGKQASVAAVAAAALNATQRCPCAAAAVECAGRAPARYMGTMPSNPIAAIKRYRAMQQLGTVSMQAFRALIAAAPAVRSLPFARAMATRTFAALGPKTGAPPSPAAPAAAAKPAAAAGATLAVKAGSKSAGPFAGLFSRKSAPRKMKAAPAKKKNAAGKVLVKRKSKFSMVMARKPKVAAKASRSAFAPFRCELLFFPLRVAFLSAASCFPFRCELLSASPFSFLFRENALIILQRACRREERGQGQVCTGDFPPLCCCRFHRQESRHPRSERPPAHVRHQVPSQVTAYNPSARCFVPSHLLLCSVKHKLIAGRSKTLKLSERTQVPPPAPLLLTPTALTCEPPPQRLYSLVSQNKMAANLASEKKRLGVKKAITVPKTVTMQALGL